MAAVVAFTVCVCAWYEHFFSGCPGGVSYKMLTLAKLLGVGGWAAHHIFFCFSFNFFFSGTWAGFQLSLTFTHT